MVLPLAEESCLVATRQSLLDAQALDFRDEGGQRSLVPAIIEAAAFRVGDVRALRPAAAQCVRVPRHCIQSLCDIQAICHPGKQVVGKVLVPPGAGGNGTNRSGE